MPTSQNGQTHSKVFDRFVGLALKGLMFIFIILKEQYSSAIHKIGPSERWSRLRMKL